MLQPNNNWTWAVCTDTESLILDISDSMVFSTAYTLKNLTNNIHVDNSFNIADAQYYSELQDTLMGLRLWSDAFSTQIALNAIAAVRFHKPLMPQSWNFTSSSTRLTSMPMFVDLVTENGVGTCMVLETSERFACVMLVDESLPVSTTKSFNQFSVIKVSLDKLNPSSLFERNSQKIA